MNTDAAAGSHLWQMVFVSFAAVLVLWQMLRGWSLGLPRQIVRLLALAAAYALALFGGRAVLPFVRPIVHLPDIVLSALGGAVLAFVAYAIMTGIGSMLFKRTGQHESGFVRLIYGAGGAFLGIFLGAFFVWLLLLGIRSVGSIAEAQVRTQYAAAAALPANSHRIVNGRLVPADAADQNSVPELLARLKNSVEMGPLGSAMQKVGPAPGGSLQTLDHLSEAFATPERAERFFSYSGARDLAMHPRLVQLRQDPQIARMLSEGRILDLLQDQRVIDALNDPTLLERVKKFDLNGALQYAKTPAE